MTDKKILNLQEKERVGGGGEFFLGFPFISPVSKDTILIPST